jgi:hypothetical protein
MDTDLKKILAELPIKPPRSGLEPYREFIEELRNGAGRFGTSPKYSRENVGSR